MDIRNYGLVSVLFLQVYSRCIKEPIPNGVALLSKEPYDSVHYECNEGYELFGVADSYCFGGVWATPVPLCHARGCSMQGYTEINNGAIDVISYGSLLVVTCYPGFIMDGKSTLSCDGQYWSEPLPHCYSAVDIKNCDFEHNSFCGWTQDYEDNPDWTIHSGETDTKRTGPSFDHTYGQAQKTGHYIYMEASIPRQYGHVSRLVSPVYSRQKSRRCFQLWYHMLGPDELEYMGSLIIFIRLPAGPNHIEEELFSVHGNQGNRWHKAEAFIELQDGDFQIVIQATRGRSHTSDIAVDDFSFFRCTNDSEIDLDVLTELSTEATNNFTMPDHAIHNINDSNVVNTTTDALEIVELENNTIWMNNSNDILGNRKSSISPNNADVSESPTTNIPKNIQGRTTISHSSTSTTSRTLILNRNTLPLENINKENNQNSYFPSWIQPNGNNAETATKNLAVYPMNIDQVLKDKKDKRKSNLNLEKRAESTTLRSTDKDSRENKSFLFNPVFIAVIVGLCSLVIVAVVIVSIVVHRRRRIWGRKTSDDQIQVLYHKNMQQTQIAQSI